MHGIEPYNSSPSPTWWIHVKICMETELALVPTGAFLVNIPGFVEKFVAIQGNPSFHSLMQQWKTYPTWPLFAQTQTVAIFLVVSLVVSFYFGMYLPVEPTYFDTCVTNINDETLQDPSLTNLTPH